MATPPSDRKLPEARVGHRRERLRLMQALGVAVVLAITAALVGASMAFAVVSVLAMIGVAFWGLDRWSARSEARDVREASRLNRDIEAIEVPEGDVSYSLRPRAFSWVVLLASVALLAVLRMWPGTVSFGMRMLLEVTATGLGLVVVVAVIKAAFLRQTILVTSSRVILPRSAWSRAVIEFPLESVEFSLWGGNSRLEIREVDGVARDFDVSTGGACLGRSQTCHLVATLRKRTTRWKHAE